MLSKSSTINLTSIKNKCSFDRASIAKASSKKVAWLIVFTIYSCATARDLHSIPFCSN